MRRESEKEKLRLTRQLGIGLTIPGLMAAGPLVGAFLGRWLDKRFGTDPWLTVALVILGIVASARQVWRLIKEISKNS